MALTREKCWLCGSVVISLESHLKKRHFLSDTQSVISVVSNCREISIFMGNEAEMDLNRHFESTSEKTAGGPEKSNLKPARKISASVLQGRQKRVRFDERSLVVRKYSST
ncbi:hypothetical protein M3Y96_01131800 [Aphelenchoides besseyi]|nr:hypothetical protein M3Y96_01131800 [Aphelenchoides besseyi]